MSKLPSQIRNIIISPVKPENTENYGKIQNNDNIIKNNILSSNEISDLMKGSKTNRNKLNIFHSPRNQIIKHFKDSLNKTSEENNLQKNKNLNQLGKGKSKAKYFF